MRAAEIMYQELLLGKVEVGAVVGCESMSNIPYLIMGARSGYKMGHQQLIDAMYNDGLIDAFYNSNGRPIISPPKNRTLPEFVSHFIILPYLLLGKKTILYQAPIDSFAQT
jgi:hypothetical protein